MRGVPLSPGSHGEKHLALDPKPGRTQVARSRASCSDRLYVEMSSSFVERDAEEANEEAENAGRGRTQSR